MKEIKLESITISLSSEGDNVRIKSDIENVIISNQRIDVISELVKQNFTKVNSYYKERINDSEETINLTDLNLISLKIVLNYLYMYNSWSNTHEKQKNRDLIFSEKDFDNPSTHDLIFNYFKQNFPKDWEQKCAILLKMGPKDLKEYYKTREDFYNK